MIHSFHITHSQWKRTVYGTSVLVGDLHEKCINTSVFEYLKRAALQLGPWSEEESKRVYRRHKDVLECDFSDGTREYSVKCRGCLTKVNATVKNKCTLHKFLPHTIRCEPLQYITYY